MKMKVLLLADPSSVHTIKWANALAQKGIDVYLFGLSLYDKENYDNQVCLISRHGYGWIKKFRDGNFIKILYLGSYFELKKILNEIKPDILHAHYASSYGLLGTLLNYHPFVLSVWGNDITEFPRKSTIHKVLIKQILKNSDSISATSYFLEKKIHLYTDKPVAVIPFGIDTKKFIKGKAIVEKINGIINIGIFKSLEEHYGIDLLIRAFKLITCRVKMPLKLLIVGGGSLERELKMLVAELNLSNKVQFTGKINHDIIQEYHNSVDIAVYPSIRESFGVAVLESSACEIPVIVSDIGGLTEVTLNNITGIVIPPGSIDMIADSMEKLILNPSLRREYGNHGREFVRKNYDWEMNVDQMISLYNQLIRYR